jgi:hypothetical protein
LRIPGDCPFKALLLFKKQKLMRFLPFEKFPFYPVICSEKPIFVAADLIRKKGAEKIWESWRL